MGRAPTMQFSLRQLLGLVTAFALVLAAWYLWTGPERAAALIRDLGGEAEWITEVGMTNTDVRPLPPMKRFSRVVIGGDWRGGRKGLRLLDSVRRLRELEIRKSPEVTSLLDVPFASFAKLRVFELEGLSVPAECASQLSTMNSLEEARFAGCQVPGEIIAVATELPMLRRLSLDGSRLRGPIPLVRHSVISYIDLRAVTVDDHDIEWLASLAAAQTIVLSDTNLNDPYLLRLSSLPLLTTISVARTRVTTAGVDEFRRRAVQRQCFVYYGQNLSK